MVVPTELGGIQEGFRNLLTGGGGDIGGFHLLHHLEQLLGGGGGDAFLLGTAVNHYQVVLSVPERLGGLADEGGVELTHHHLDKLQFVLGLYQRLLVKEVADDRADELRVLAGFGAVDAVLVHGDDIGLGALEFVLGDTVFLETDQFRVEGLEAFQDVVLAEGNISHDGVDVLIDEGRYVEAAVQIRGTGLGGDVVETLVHNLAQDALEEFGDLTGVGGVERFGSSGAVPDELDAGAGGLGIRDNAYAGLGVVCNLLDGLLDGILLDGNGAENFFNLGLGAGYVHVTDYDHGLVSGVIPGVVELHEALGLESFQVLLRADEGAGSQLAVRAEVVGEGSLHAAPAGVAAGAALLDDNAPLGINLGGLVEHIVGIVCQDHQAGVHYGLPLHGDVVEHILGFLETGGCIDVAAEFGTDGAEVIQDGFTGEMLRTVEAHVLQEVSQAVLGGVFFLDGTYIGGEVEFCPSLGKFVVADKVSKTVVQMSYGVGL